MSWRELAAGRRYLRRPVRQWLGLGLVAASVAVAALIGGIEPDRLANQRGADSAVAAVRGLLQPDLGREHLARIAGLAVETVLIGALGTALALVLGVILAILAARLPQLRHAPTPRSWTRIAAPLVRYLARAALSFLRSVPEIVWAFLFVRIFGLGPGAAIAAIALSFGGILGKLYAELIEAVPPEPARQLRASGAGWPTVLVFGVLPLVRTQWIAYGLFRFECALRSAAILGI
ncbi:MAG: ABC transporter permease subunit, partial [Myxococcota bacterium]